MVTITVDAINEDCLPKPSTLRLWRDNWLPLLNNNLTPWQAVPGQFAFRCTTTVAFNAMPAAVGTDLDNWVNGDPGHRNYSIT